MKAYFDSCAVDAVLEGPYSEALKARIADGRIDAWVGAEVISEVAKTPLRSDRRLRLMSVIGHVIKPAPTNIPIVGGRPADPTAQFGASKMIWRIVGGPEGQAMFTALQHLGITKLDAVHLVEAALGNANVLVTTDKEDLLKKSTQITELTNVRVISPADLLAEAA